MKKIDKITTLGKMMLKDKITSSWDKLLTEKQQGDLMVFYKKRLEHFWRLPDLEKIIGKEKAARSYAAMEEVDVLFEDKGIKPLPPPLGQNAFKKLLREASSSRPIAAYIHIPFCAKRCLYCDFFSNTDMKFKEPYIDAAIREMELRQEYIGGEPLDTIYFGGGTPSQLQQADFERIFEAADRLFGTSSCTEITLEANPDDMTPEYVASLRNLPFNRISMGVQSFKEKDLRFLNRRHDREQALRAVGLCKENGIQNISIDLIYGLPGQTLEEWQENLDDAIRLEIPHISAYHLIYEEGTALYKLMEAGKVTPIEEDLSVTLFSTLINRLTEAGYLHYEISNFGRPGYFSRHNSSYWTGTKYIGIGPSAHSYDGESRQWNISSLPRYLQGIKAGIPDIEIEELDINTKYNDFIITGLRTMWGIRTADIRERFGEEKQTYLEQQAATYLRQGLLIRENDTLTLSKKGIFISDGIMSDLLWV